MTKSRKKLKPADSQSSAPSETKAGPPQVALNDYLIMSTYTHAAVTHFLSLTDPQMPSLLQAFQAAPTPACPLIWLMGGSNPVQRSPGQLLFIKHT